VYKNPTTALYMSTPLYSHYTLLHVSAHKGTSLGSTDTFYEQGQPNACPDVNIILKTRVLCDTWHFDWHLDRYFVDSAHKTYQYSLGMSPCGLQHVAVHSVNIVVLTYIVR
jgi:hypothetical protein